MPRAILRQIRRLETRATIRWWMHALDVLGQVSRCKTPHAGARCDENSAQTN